MAAGRGSDQFWTQGFLVIEGLLSAGQCRLLCAGIETAARQGAMRQFTNDVHTGPYNQYRPVAGQAVLDAFAQRLGGVVDRRLLPAYSFWRTYEAGSSLARHVDRSACEISATVALGSDPPGLAWPIQLTDLAGQDHAVPLAAGSALLYLGCRVPHWRDPLPAGRQHQLFLHYVDADGPSAGLAGDPHPTRGGGLA